MFNPQGTRDDRRQPAAWVSRLTVGVEYRGVEQRGVLTLIWWLRSPATPRWKMRFWIATCADPVQLRTGCSRVARLIRALHYNTSSWIQTRVRVCVLRVYVWCLDNQGYIPSEGQPDTEETPEGRKRRVAG